MNWVRASRCWHAPDCVELAWHTAEASQSNGHCVEVAHCEDVHIGDSKNREGGFHTVSREAASAFFADIKAGRFDL